MYIRINDNNNDNDRGRVRDLVEQHAEEHGPRDLRGEGRRAGAAEGTEPRAPYMLCVSMYIYIYIYI